MFDPMFAVDLSMEAQHILKKYKGTLVDNVKGEKIYFYHNNVNLQ
jgi:hypothetical protein